MAKNFKQSCYYGEEKYEFCFFSGTILVIFDE